MLLLLAGVVVLPTCTTVALTVKGAPAKIEEKDIFGDVAEGEAGLGALWLLLEAFNEATASSEAAPCCCCRLFVGVMVTEGGVIVRSEDINREGVCVS